MSHLEPLNNFLSSLKKNANYHPGFMAYVIWTLSDPPGASKAILSPLHHHSLAPSPWQFLEKSNLFHSEPLYLLLPQGPLPHAMSGPFLSKILV